MSRRSRFAIAEPADGSVLRWPGAASKFALLGEALWVGILVAVASLPVVTWPAAFAAGASHLRRFLRGESATVGQFVDDVRRAVPGGVVVGAASLLVALLIVLDIAIARDGGLPGAAAVAVVLSVAAAAAALVVVTAAASWRPGRTWWAVVASSPGRLARDPFAAVMTAVALGLAAVITWQYALLVVPAAGMLVFAVVAVQESRGVPA
ncbi:hypothetical protein TESS_TESS_01597 [Tessaracoccus sp. O5.2]|uniref:hypothetical protein n=1 Tax=Tessaracoccus sp. O5.2 TaxID=3157622 RepID=UPI0035EDC4C6